MSDGKKRQSRGREVASEAPRVGTGSSKPLDHLHPFHSLSMGEGAGIPGRGTSQREGPEKGQCVVCMRASKDSVARLSEWRRNPERTSWRPDGMGPRAIVQTLVFTLSDTEPLQFGAKDKHDLTDVLFKQSRKLLNSQAPG